MDKMIKARESIAKLAAGFIDDGAVSCWCPVQLEYCDLSNSF